MNDISKKLTNFTTILLLILKECRLERNVHQAIFAEMLGKSPSTINKVESGSAALQMDMFLSYCRVMNISPSYVLAAAERYAALFQSQGWNVATQSIETNEDLLLNEATEYYASSHYKQRMNSPFFTTLNGPIYYSNGQVGGIEVFIFALFPSEKEKMLKNEYQLPNNFS